MFGGVKGNSGNNVAVDSGIHTGQTGAGGFLSEQKDAKEAETAPKFGDVYKQIQAKYGAKPQKPREIKKTLDKDDFLKIMINQMKNQDPTNPFKAEQMATEMAQFTSVEQLHNVNNNLAKMANQNQPLERLAMMNMIGKTVTVDRERFPHAEGESESLSFYLPDNAKQSKISIVSDSGETVFEKDLGPQKAGEVNVSWDGRKTNNLPAKAGNYMMRVEAKNDKDMTIESNPKTTGKVVGISFEGSEPVFLVGDNKHQEKVTMRDIVTIEQDGAGSGGLVPAQKNEKAFFSFTPGVGSSALQVSQPPSAPQAKKVARAEPAPEPVRAEGFPNGLHDENSMNPQPKKGGEQK